MKSILFIVYLIFGPDLQAVQQANVWSMDKGTEEACMAEVARYERNGLSAGRVGNLPGYRYVHAAWHEERAKECERQAGGAILRCQSDDTIFWVAKEEAHKQSAAAIRKMEP